MTAASGLPPRDIGLPAARIARRLVELSNGTVDAVLLYGSHAHGAGPDQYSALDLLVIVTDYGDFYQALHSAGMLHRPAWVMSALARILPPNSIAFSPGEASDGLGKCLVITRKHFAEALGPRRKDHFVVARMLQTVLVLFGRSEADTAWVMHRIEEARDHLLDWLGPFLDVPFDAGSVGRRFLDVSYGAEIRPESINRSTVIFDRQREQMENTLSPLLARHAAAGALEAEGSGYRFATPPSRFKRLSVQWYFIRSNARITARWFKHVVTFQDWLAYLTRKVERRTGSRIELTALERRWPLIFLWPRAIRTLRARPDTEPGGARAERDREVATLR